MGAFDLTLPNQGASLIVKSLFYFLCCPRHRRNSLQKDAITEVTLPTQILKLQNQRGQTLIQMLVASAIGIVIIMAMMSAQNSLSRQNQELTQTLARADFQQQMIRSFADGSLCTALLTQPSPQVFDSTHARPGDPNPPTIILPAYMIPLSTAANATPLVSAGQAVSAISTSVVADSSSPFRIVNIVGSSTAGVGIYSGSLQVSFDPSRLILALKPASVQVTLLTTSSGTTQTVTACHTSQSPPSCRIVTNVGRVPPVYTSDARCASYEYLLSGGAQCETGVNDLGCGGPKIQAYLHYNGPDGDMKGWSADCNGYNLSADTCSMAWAVCCLAQ